jgi:hypothetical protein
MPLPKFVRQSLSSLLFISCIGLSLSIQANTWILIDDFEASNSVMQWSKADTKNDTLPKVSNPQITERQEERNLEKNAYLLKKPAAEGIIGNRKALTYKKLPIPVPVGETFTFYSKINVEYFPNNHAFGLSNLSPKDIELNGYNAFEPTLRVTDKTESSGLINTGALMVKTSDAYANIYNSAQKKDADPLVPGTWYEIWYVVDNSLKKAGGQHYNVYFKGGNEFPQQTKVYKNATFRMSRELPLIYFLMNCNTGPKNKPYGNGGLKYDDLYMSKGVNLTTPLL